MCYPRFPSRSRSFPFNFPFNEIVQPAAPAPPQVKEEVPVVKSETVEAQPVVAQKKGQSEFVSFVEPEVQKTKRRVAEPTVVAGGHYNNNLFLLGWFGECCLPPGEWAYNSEG